MYACFDSESYWGSCQHRSACSCKDASFGGVRDLDAVAAEAEPFPKVLRRVFARHLLRDTSAATDESVPTTHRREPWAGGWMS